MISLKAESPQQKIGLRVTESQGIGLGVKDFVGDGTKDYNKLENLPTLNGETIKGNVEEKDPTVPDWAKRPDKPRYTPEEIGMEPIPLAEIAKMFEDW